MKISTLDRCLMDMDMSQNPLLCQLIQSSDLTPDEIKDLVGLVGSINSQVQIATVVKSGLRSILITAKGTLVKIPALSMLEFIKPENISPTLTIDEHRAIMVHARGGNQSTFFKKPIFQQPVFLIAKNMIFSMIVKDVTDLLYPNLSKNPPSVEEARKKLDNYFDTIPDSPMPDNAFQNVHIPISSPKRASPSFKQLKRLNSIASSTSFKRLSSKSTSPSFKRVSSKSSSSSSSTSFKRLSSKTPLSRNNSEISWEELLPDWLNDENASTQEQQKQFDEEISILFPTD